MRDMNILELLLQGLTYTAVRKATSARSQDVVRVAAMHGIARKGVRGPDQKPRKAYPRRRSVEHMTHAELDALEAGLKAAKV